MNKINSILEKFALANGFTEKGPLCVALVMTRRAKDTGLPLNPDEQLTKRGGQVAGLGKSAVQAILLEHDIEKVLASEGGRTSRGSVENMRKYVAFLNELNKERTLDLDEIEKWWAGKARDYFSRKPFTLNLDPSKSLSSVVRDILEQAKKKQADSPGSTVVGTVLQHLVGAKLELLFDIEIEHRGASVADEQLRRDADFHIGDVAIHVTAAPGENLIMKCERNLRNGLRPVILTNKSSAAEELAEQVGISDRVDIFDAEPYIASNLLELGGLAPKGRRETADRLIAEYNKIIENCETDHSLRILIKGGLDD